MSRRPRSQRHRPPPATIAPCATIRSGDERRQHMSEIEPNLRSRAKMAAGVLFLSGVLMGATLDRVSVWLTPVVVLHPPSGQISRALEPGNPTPASSVRTGQAEKDRPAQSAPGATDAASAAGQNAATEGTANATAERPRTDGSGLDEAASERTKVSQQPPPSIVKPTLLNPGAAQDDPVERATSATRDKAATQEELVCFP